MGVNSSGMRVYDAVSQNPELLTYTNVVTA